MAMHGAQKQKRNWGMIIAFVILLIIAIALLIVLLTLTFKEPGCDTRECVTAAAEMMDTMNLDAEPCDDYYEYACGNFGRQVPWTERYYWTTSSQIKSKVFDQLFKEMQAADVENNSTEKAKAFFQTCMDTNAINARGSEPLKVLIKFLGSWELSRGSSGTLRAGSWDLAKNLGRAHGLRRPIFFDVRGGSTDLERYMVVPRPELPQDIIDTFAVEARESTVAFIENVAKLLNPGTTVSDLDKIANDIYNLNYNISQRDFKCQTEREEPLTFKSMQELDQHLGSWFDLETYWKELTGQAALPSTGNVTLVCPGYFKDLESLLNPSTTSKETQANSLVWNSIYPYTAAMGNEYRSAFKRSIRWLDLMLVDVSSSQERWEYCLEQSLNFFPGPLLAIYASSAYDESKREEVDGMVTAIVDTYREELENDISWVDVDKEMLALKALKRQIARDSMALDYEKMDEEYDDYTVTDNSFDNQKTLNSKGVERQLESLADSKSRPAYTKGSRGSHHLDSPSAIDIYGNILDIPSGALQRPYYSPDFPGAVNFGALAMEIASEFVPFESAKASASGSSSSAVVDTNTTADGNSTSPLTIFGSRFARSVAGRQRRDTEEEDRTLASILEQLRKQHNDLNLSGFEITTRDARRIMKDLGGVQLAYKAYQKWLESHSDTARMVGLDLDEEEVFFLGYAQSHCMHVTAELKEKIKAFHIQFMERAKALNQILMNTAEFADAYGCSQKDGTMHPEFEKVDVWE